MWQRSPSGSRCRRSLGPAATATHLSGNTANTGSHQPKCHIRRISQQLALDKEFTWWGSAGETRIVGWLPTRSSRARRPVGGDIGTPDDRFLPRKCRVRGPSLPGPARVPGPRGTRAERVPGPNEHAGHMPGPSMPEPTRRGGPSANSRRPRQALSASVKCEAGTSGRGPPRPRRTDLAAPQPLAAATTRPHPVGVAPAPVARRPPRSPRTCGRWSHLTREVTRSIGSAGTGRPRTATPPLPGNQGI